MLTAMIHDQANPSEGSRALMSRARTAAAAKGTILRKTSMGSPGTSDEQKDA
jgi:hypothetical protein